MTESNLQKFKNRKIAVLGGSGMVGSALARKLAEDNQSELLLPTRKELDLFKEAEVKDFFSSHSIEVVYLAAAKVGGILANQTYPADFIYQNLLIQNNVIAAAYMSGVRKLLYFGSSCIYPKFSNQPISELELLGGPLEPTNEPYAVAKIAGIKLCESFNRQYGCDYRCVMPTNLYGPGDYFHNESAHVIPALMRRMHDSKVKRDKELVVWGSGNPRREFLHVDDLASASVYIMSLDETTFKEHVGPTSSFVNVGTGKDCSIRELVELLCETVGYEGKIVYDRMKPDGTPRKLLCVSRLKDLGWQHKIKLSEGLRQTYRWFLANQDHYRC